MKEEPRHHSIAMIICYMGKLPWYFDFFAHSCTYNPSIDFYIITDDTTYNGAIPKNVIFIFKNLNEVSQLATKKLGFDIEIKFAYKLCDFKPAYGLIFEDILKGYDIWGFGDIDVIYGNIRNFMTPEILASYELISVRPDWVPGCFVLMQNNDKMKRLFEHSKDYIMVFESDTHFCFDETNFAHEAFTEGKKYNEINTEIESYMHIIQRLEENNNLKVYYDLHIVEGIPGRLKWTNGTMTYRKNYEILLYHMIRLKRNYKQIKRLKTIPNSFKISPTKIYQT